MIQKTASNVNGIISRRAPETVFPPFEYANLLDHADFGDWRDTLATDGYVVLPAVVPRETALRSREAALSWLEAFPRGFKRDDPNTHKTECLPVQHKGGMMSCNGVAHEQWVWDVRGHPAVVDAFAKVWGTDELVVSFDAITVAHPNRTDIYDAGRWEHMDQSPCRRGFHCLQGLVNLNDCGKDDGGLMILKGSPALMGEFFDMFGREETRTWGPQDFYSFTDDQHQWFYDRGCEWVKVCVEAGDLILWDSRAMHYSVSPTGKTDRAVIYVCMGPTKLLTEKNKEDRRYAFENYLNTNHVPYGETFVNPRKPGIRSDTGLPDQDDDGIPQNPRAASDRILKLAGVKAY